MLTIQKVKANQSKAQPTHLPLKCMVPLLLPPTQYVKDGIPKKVQSLILCDSTGFLKATSFDVTKTEGLKVNSSIILKNFISRADAIIITQSTKIFKTTPLHVEEAIVNAAILHLRPPTPPPSSYSAIKMSPVKSIQTVVGKLVQDETPREVTVKGNIVSVRTVTIENQGQQIKLSLWKDLAQHEIKTGDFFTATNVVVSDYQNERQISSTSRTKIQKSSPPEELFSVTLLAFETLPENEFELLCQLDGEELITFRSPGNILPLLLPITRDPFDTSDTEDESPSDQDALENQLLANLPGLCEIFVQQGVVTRVHARLVKL